MLPIKLRREEVDILMEDAKETKSLSIDLESQTITRDNGSQIGFDIDPFRKHCLLNGLDDIGLTMQKSDLISSFETARSESYPWLDNASQLFIEDKSSPITVKQ